LTSGKQATTIAGAHPESPATAVASEAGEALGLGDPRAESVGVPVTTSGLSSSPSGASTCVELNGDSRAGEEAPSIADPSDKTALGSVEKASPRRLPGAPSPAYGEDRRIGEDLEEYPGNLE
jgi:hypothetical protein